MPSIDKTFSFLSDAEGLAEQGGSANISFAWDGSDGVPSGCVKFTESGVHVATETEKARQSSSQTWETWGVPPAATVTGVEIVSGQQKSASSGSYSLTGFIRVVAPGGTRVHGATDLASFQATGPPFWGSAALGLLGAQSVDSSYQASTTPVCLELEATGATLGGSSDLRLDALTLRITYTGGTGSPTDPTDPTNPAPPPNGGIYLDDGTYLTGAEVCGAGIADKFTLVTWMRDGHQ